MNYYQISVIKYAERLYIFFEFNNLMAMYVYFACIMFSWPFFWNENNRDDGDERGRKNITKL